MSLKQQIPEIEGVADTKAASILRGMKNIIDGITGRRVSPIKSLGPDASVVGILNKVNEVIARLQEDTPPVIGAGVGAKRLLGQVVTYQTGAVATGTTLIPLDDTIPQNTEGDEYMTLAITPASATSLLEIDIEWIGSHSVAADVSCALFQDTIANALAAAVMYADAATGRVAIPLKYTMTSGATSATTFKVRVGATVAGTTTFNGYSGGRIFGGVMASRITIKEWLP